MSFRQRCQPYLFLAPALVLFGVFTLYPIVRSVQMSFTDYEFVQPEQAKYVGLDNYREALRLYAQDKDNDSKTRQTFRNTLYYTVLFLPPYVLLPIPVAFLIDRLRRGQVFMRVISFLPIVVSGAVIAVLWTTLYHPRYGPIAAVARSWFGLEQLDVLGSKATAMPALVTMAVWHGFGFNVLMYLVTLASIPHELYEAAAVDGGDKWATFRHVSLPLLRPAIYLVTLLGAIGSLKVFGPMFIMTGGGPSDSTSSLVLYIYQTAFTFGNLRMGYAAAVAFLLAIVVLTFAILASRLNRPVDK